VGEWLRTSEAEDSSRDGYVNYIERYVKPVLGELSVRKVDARVNASNRPRSPSRNRNAWPINDTRH